MVLERAHVLQAFARRKGKSLRGRLDRMEECCAVPMVYETSDGHPLVSLGFCRDRLCPTCQRHRGRKVAVKVEQTAGKMDSPRFVTLTLRSSPESLKSAIGRLFAAFRKLRRVKSWRKRVTGGVYALEVTWNAETGLWHPHIHAIIDGSFYPQRALSDDWLEASGDSKIVDIRAVHSRRSVASYIARYVAKPMDVLDWTHKAICEYAEALAGTRMVHTWGKFHGTQPDEREEPEAPKGCRPLCSTSRVLWHAERRHPYAVCALSLLRRMGPPAVLACGGTTAANEPALPPLEDWERVRLVVCLRRLSGDSSAVVDDLEPPPERGGERVAAPTAPVLFDVSPLSPGRLL